MSEVFNILALSGSLRKKSYNTAVIRALRKIAPDDISVVVYDGLGEIPPFNPDIDPAGIPVVRDLKKEVEAAEGLIISSPEYAHGISGVLKNALDWLVSGYEFINMPVSLVNTSPRAHHALDSLKEVLKTMSGTLFDASNLTIPLLGTHYGYDELVNDENITRQLHEYLRGFKSDARRANIVRYPGETRQP